MRSRAVRMWLDNERPMPEGFGLVRVRSGAEAVAVLAAAHAEFDAEFTAVDWIEQAIAEKGFVPPTKMKAYCANPADCGYDRIDAATDSIVRLAGRGPVGEAS